MKKSDNIQTEVDASYLYLKLAENETDPAIAEIYREMSDIEKGHAMAFLQKNQPGITQLPSPSTRARVIQKIGKTFGYSYVLGILMDTEKGLSKTIIRTKQLNDLPVTGSETNHVKILQSILDRGGVSGDRVAQFESRHRSVGGNALRAGVLGGNDGLVSNFSLVMGVAGATNGEDGVLLAGSAGLLAGALSMALGEWISVKSSQELNENQMKLEMDELETNPEGERKELILIYMAKGLDREKATSMVDDIMLDKEKAHSILIREELGINMDEVEGSAMEAALYSFFLFAIGASIPVIPFVFTSGTMAIVLSTGMSAIGLFLIGSAITIFTGKNIWFSGMRQVLFGLAAAAITFGIGKLIGVSLAG